MKRLTNLDSLLARLAAATPRQGAPDEVRQRLLVEVEAARLSSPPARSGTAQAFFHAMLWFAAIATVLIAAGRFLAPTPARMPPVNTEPVSALDDAQRAAPAGYFSLPYSDPSIANGTEATVRVSVPASQLMAWGVPALGRGPDEELPADLLLGDDGLPQAIRILPVTSSTSTTEENYP